MSNIADEDELIPIPNLKLQQALFVLSRPESSEQPHIREAAKTSLLEGIEKDEMAPYYAAILEDPSTSSLLSRDDALLARLRSKNEAELAKLAEQQKKAEEEEGETEINSVLKARALYYARIGDKTNAVAAHKVAYEKAVGLGSKLDLTLTQVRVGLFFGDTEITTTHIAKAKTLVEEGGDWDRRNRLKVYEGLHLLSIRDFKQGGELFLDALSTFTATELIDYNDFVTLTVIANMLVLKRVDLKKKLMQAPEVLQVIDDIPHLRPFMTSLHGGDYASFFRALAAVEQTHLLPSRVLNPHARYYTREMRIIAYAQLLESYKSLTLENMSAAFGVSVDFVDRELARFISAGRLPAVIDKVSGVVETRRPDTKNAQYAKIIKDGDVLLNQLQKLSRTAL
ncbi:proteasome regulatory particle subunit [Tilletia horrida]|nr:proteasome regulatory particle subunit [Tilletia horrida]KAK0533714.1 proteasome regulatory particle subunit [Tilletia horrida]KAK0566096.1 proteasome regulatory particle subunit [Tilletia horrida]